MAVNGAICSENTDVSLSHDFAKTVVKTIAKGFSGTTPGSAMTSFSASFVVPSLGQEINWSKYKDTDVTVELYMGAESCVIKGAHIMDVKEEGQESGNVKVSINGVGPHSVFQ